jgi:hypothetical protein
MSIIENEIKVAVASILKRGLLLIRSVCKKDPALAQAEAYHLHNLPHLLASFSVALLRYYADIERPDYIHTVGPDLGKIHEDDWRIIDDFLKENRE